MSVSSKSLKAVVLIAAAGLFYFLVVAGPSSASPVCQCGADRNGKCIPCPQGCPPGPPGSCKVQPVIPGGGRSLDYPPPKGSYQRSCNLITYDPDSKTLSANCSPRQGPAHRTTLGNIEQCVGDIANMDGTLQCSKGGSPPPGSYKESCRDMRVGGGSLFAQCLDRKGNWLPTKLDNYASCGAGVENINGTLRCK